MATTVLGLKTFTASDPVDYNEINDNYTKIDNGVKTAFQGRAAHNWLVNSWFVNPVNQRGKTSYSASGYTIDRWYLYNPNGDGTIAINNGYISLTGGSGAVSLSCRFPKGFLDASKTYTARICDNLGNINPAGLNFYDSFDTFEISAGAGETKNIVWAALYEGSYTANTLPAYQPKGYSAELAECMRYYRPMPYPVIPCGNNPAGTQVYGFLPFRMRITNPTVSCDTLYYFKGDTTFCSVSSASAESYGSGTRIVFNLSQSVEGNLAGAVAGNRITISADL